MPTDTTVFSPLSRSFWAKTMRSSDPGEKKSVWGLSVVQHSIDVGSVIVPLAEKLMAPAQWEKCARAVEAPHSGTHSLTREKFLQFIGMVHDCGKISYAFQIKAPDAFEEAKKQGFRDLGVSLVDRQQCPHNLVSAIAVYRWIEKRVANRIHGGLDRRLRGNLWELCQVLAGHHGYFSDGRGVERVVSSTWLDLIERDQAGLWSAARESFLDEVAEYLGFSDEDIEALARINWDLFPPPLLEGILVCADWVGSSGRFPLLGSSEPLSAADVEQRTSQALAELDLGERWVPAEVTDENFAARAGLPPGTPLRSLQQQCLEIARDMHEPGLVLIESETGSGKTEAALAMAETLAKNLGLSGVFFAQPTRVTSDAMFDRVLRWMSTGVGPSGELARPVSAVLAHGKSNFNESFRKLVPQVGSIFSEDEGEYRPEEAGQHLVAYDWFRGRHTALLASVVVGTIDQLLMAALKTRFTALRHMGLAGKVVIIDELHASDTWMQTFLFRVITWLARYGVPVIGLSATLPAETRARLVAAYQKGVEGSSSRAVSTSQRRGGEEEACDSSGVDLYPAITVVRGTAVRVVSVMGEEGHRTVEIDFECGPEVVGNRIPDAAIKRAIQAASEGAKVAVICSTVGRAQATYTEVKTKIASVAGGGEALPQVLLLHSRFTADSRIRRENFVVSALGRSTNGAASLRNELFPHGCVVVATQVIEQGLDLDFDYLVTDIAPIDLLIQRAGRVHRHRENDGLRPASYRIPRITVTGFTMDNDGPHFHGGACRVYQEKYLLGALAALQLKGAGDQFSRSLNLTIPSDVPALIQTAYSCDLESPTGWEEKWIQAAQRLTEFRARQESGARAMAIPDGGRMCGWGRATSSGTEQQMAAQVRDADSSIEVIVVKKVDGVIRPIHSLEGFGDIALDAVGGIDSDLAFAVAKCSLRLPSWCAHDIDDLIEELETEQVDSWQTSGWLSGELPLVLDSQLQKKLRSGAILRYSDELGLEVIMGI